MNKIYQSIIVICLLVSACKTTEPVDPFLGFDFYGKDLAANLTAYNSVQSEGDAHLKKGSPAMYVDFSAGMNTAFKAGGIKELMPQCFNTVLARQFEVYKLAQNSVTPLLIKNTTELGQLVNDPGQYLDVRAPIQAAVERIVAAKNDALLITDFEEWQNDAEVTGTAYLKIPFSKWLRDGNSISFFIADYQEGKVQKHIYFTVFTYGRATDNSLIRKLRPKLAVLPAKFDLATDAYLLHTSYKEAGGIFRDAAGKTAKEQNILDLQAGYLDGMMQERPFEYYPLGVNWETIGETRKDYAQLGQFHDLFRNLYINLTNTDSYTNINLEVKTYDATSDFERYVKSVEAKKHRPKLTKGTDGENKIADQEINDLARNCYKPDGSLKPEFFYKRVDATALPDIFTLNQTLFDNTAHTDKSNIEIGIAFARRFGADKIPNPAGLIKVVVNVNGAIVNAACPALQKMKWINQKGVENIGLYESVKSTLEELKPANKTIYTYYIKTTE